MSTSRQPVVMPGGGIRYMTGKDIIAVARIQRQDAPAEVSSSELAMDGTSTGQGLPVDELSQMIGQLQVRQKKSASVSSGKPMKNVVSGQGVARGKRGGRVAYV